MHMSDNGAFCSGSELSEALSEILAPFISEMKGAMANVEGNLTKLEEKMANLTESVSDLEHNVDKLGKEVKSAI